MSVFRPYPKQGMQKKKKVYSYKKKPTGEAILFRTLWEVRPHVSFIDGSPLGDEMKTWTFAHVIPKSVFPKFRLYDKNLVFLTAAQHDRWDKGSREALRKDPKWRKMFELEEQLKQEYHDLERQQRNY